MARSSQDSSPSSSTSKRHVRWTKKVGNEDDQEVPATFKSSSNPNDQENKKELNGTNHHRVSVPNPEMKPLAVVVDMLRSVLTAFGKHRSNLPTGLGPRVVGTLFGYRGQVHFACQKDPISPPAFLIELATPISGLVREMESGSMRIVLECDKEKEDKEMKAIRLLEEPTWRAYCNGKKCGFATRRECGAKKWKVLRAVKPISMDARVLPAAADEAGATDGELVSMRAEFERFVGSRDFEAFDMMNPDSKRAPKLSIYLLRY